MPPRTSLSTSPFWVVSLVPDLEHIAISILRLLEELPYRMGCELEALLNERNERGSVSITEDSVGSEEPDSVKDWPKANQGSFLSSGDWVFAHPEEH